MVTPEGKRVRLELAWFGPTHKAPYTTDVPVEKYTYYQDAEGNKVLHGEYARLFVNGRMKDFTTYVHGVKRELELVADDFAPYIFYHDRTQ